MAKCIGVVACLVWSAFLGAAFAASDVPTVTFPKVSTPPVVDGDLSDKAWANATRLTNFKDYRDGSLVTRQTTVLGCYDEKALYVAFVCDEPDTARLKAEATDEGEVAGDDCVELFVKPGHATSYYHFLLNSKNIHYDQRVWGGRRDNDWDGEWKSAAKIDPGKAWVVEMAIPWYNFAADLDRGDWFIQFCRQKRTEPIEISSWSFADGGFHNTERFAKLTRPKADFAALWGLKVYGVQVKDCQAMGDGHTCAVEGVVESVAGRKLRLTVEDRPFRGSGSTSTCDLTVTPGQGVQFSVPLRIPAVGTRKLALRLDDAKTGMPLYVNAYGMSIFPEVAKCKTIKNLEAGKHQHIVTHGTSLTAGGAWVIQVYQALNQRYYGGLVTITNSGVGASTSNKGMRRLEEWVLARNPDTVFIEFAINDAYEPYKPSPEKCRANLENMIDRILKHNPECEIIPMTTNPVVGKAAEVRPHLEDYYQVYREVAKERGLLLIDHYPAWKKILEEARATFDKYIPDGLHPGELGCRKVITPAILRAMGF